MPRHIGSLARWLAVPACLYLNCAYGLQIDGRLDPDEWQDAERVSDFRQVVPLTGEPARVATESWIQSTPQGLAIAFRNRHPASVPRTEQRVQRDFEDLVDQVDVMIDFDADSRIGYVFTVSSTGAIYDATLSNERELNKDWDGAWQHAVARDEAGWTAEILIPWHIAPMRAAAGDTRTMKIYVDRLVAATGERSRSSGSRSSIFVSMRLSSTRKAVGLRWRLGVLAGRSVMRGDLPAEIQAPGRGGYAAEKA